MDNYEELKELLELGKRKKLIRDAEMAFSSVDIKKSAEKSIKKEKVEVKRKTLLKDIKYAAGAFATITVIALSVGHLVEYAKAPFEAEKKSISTIAYDEYSNLNANIQQNLIDDAYMLLREGLNSNYYDILVYDIYNVRGPQYLDKVFNILSIMTSSDQKYAMVRCYASSEEYFKSLGFIGENGEVLEDSYNNYMSNVKNEFYKQRFEKFDNSHKTI